MSHEFYQYKLVVSYLGSGFSGFQKQTDSTQTIQGEIERVLSEICKSDQVKSMGSGRTDAGVHALNQVVKVSIPLKIGTVEIMKAINSLIHPNIHIKEAHIITDDFCPTRDVVVKEYVYLFSNNKTESPFQKELMANCSYELDVKLMQKACSYFIGKHDFKDFYCVGTEVRSTVREIFLCELTLEEPTGHIGRLIPAHYVFRVQGEGFLKQMVRLMVGTLWSIGRHKVDLDQLKLSLEGKSNGKLGNVAPPQGLYLSRVTY